MNTVSSRLCLLALLLSGCGWAGLPGGGPARDTVLLLHTNDIHSHLLPHTDGRGGLARISGYAARERARRPDVLLLDAGDGVSGTPVSSIYGGRPVFAVMGVMGYDAMALGNHEFDPGWARIEEFRRLAPFPILSANVRAPEGGLLADASHVVRDVDGVRVAILGATTPLTPEMTAPGAVGDCVFEDPAGAVAALVTKLDGDADLIVVLSHLGVEADRELARCVPGIDVIVGGHSHTALLEPEVVGETVLVQAGAYARFLGRLELTVDRSSGRVVHHEGSLLAVDDTFPLDDRTTEAVRIWEDGVGERVDVVVGRGAGALAPDRVRRAVEEEALGTDLAFQNPGGVRAPLDAGEITIRDLWTILPFENTLVTVHIRGGDLPEWSREQLPSPEPDRLYTVATNSFVAGHPEQYFPRGFESAKDSGLPMRDTVIEAVRRKTTLD